MLLRNGGARSQFRATGVGGTSWIARALTSVGDRTAAFTSAGIGNWESTEKVTFAAFGCGSIFSTVPTATPRMRISSPV